MAHWVVSAVNWVHQFGFSSVITLFCVNFEWFSWILSVVQLVQTHCTGIAEWFEKKLSFSLGCQSFFWQNPKWRFALFVDLRLPSFVVRSSITKWAARMSQERFDLESPNFIQKSIPAHPTATRNMTSLANSGWHLSKLKNGRLCHLQRLWV